MRVFNRKYGICADGLTIRVSIFLFFIVHTIHCQNPQELVLYIESPTLSKTDFYVNLMDNWGIEIDTTQFLISDKAAVLTIDSSIIGLIFNKIPVSWNELEPPCMFSYTWPEAPKKMKEHTMYIKVNFMRSHKNVLEKKKLLAKVVYSLLELTDAIGVYVKEDQLVRSRKEYLIEAEKFREYQLPVANWIFIGVAKDSDSMSAGFTVGMEQFGFKDMEIEKSKQTLPELYVLLYNIIYYVLSESVTLLEGDKVGMEQNHQYPITINKSNFIKEKNVVVIDY